MVILFSSVELDKETFSGGMGNIGTVVVFNDGTCAISIVPLSPLIGFVVEVFSYSGDEPYNVVDSIGL